MLKSVREQSNELLGDKVADLPNAKQKQGVITLLNLERGSRLTALIVVLAGLIFAPYAFADDEDDVLAAVQKYAELEDDLEAQA